MIRLSRAIFAREIFLFHTRPTAAVGLRIGLLGGSFDPAHDGHLHISRIALHRLQLDRVWWLLSPGNPLKSDAPASLERRLVAANTLLDDHPKIEATGIERELGTVYTADTVHALQARYSTVRFVWLMGADNLTQFHRWQRWVQIMHTVPVCVLARPGEQVRAGLSLAARRFAAMRLPEYEATALPFCTPPCWTMLSHPTSPLSSTALRANGAWT